MFRQTNEIPTMNDEHQKFCPSCPKCPDFPDIDINQYCQPCPDINLNSDCNSGANSRNSKYEVSKTSTELEMNSTVSFSAAIASAVAYMAGLLTASLLRRARDWRTPKKNKYTVTKREEHSISTERLPRLPLMEKDHLL